MFLLFPLCWVFFFFSLYHKWMLNFVKCFFCAYWVVHMIFTLCSLRILVSLYGLDMSKAGLIKWRKFVWEGFKSRASVSWSQLALPDQSPSGDLPFSVGPLSWGAWCGACTPYSSGRSSTFVIPFPLVSTRGWGPGKTVFVTFTCLNMAPPPFLWKCYSINTILEVLLGETCSLYSCSFGVSLEEVSSGYSILNMNPLTSHLLRSLKPKFSSFLYVEVIPLPLLLRFWTEEIF